MSKYYITNLDEKVKKVCDECGVCNRIKTTSQTGLDAGNPMHLNVVKAKRPFEKLQLDYFTPSVACEKHGFDRVLLISDCYSGMIWLFPTKGEGAESAVHALKALFNTYGLCREINTDRGSAFIAELNTMICSFYDIKKKLASAINPRSQGQAEGANKIVKKLLNIALLGKEDVCLDKVLPDVAFAANNAIDTRSKIKPFMASTVLNR